MAAANIVVFEADDVKVSMVHLKASQRFVYLVEFGGGAEYHFDRSSAMAVAQFHATLNEDI